MRCRLFALSVFFCIIGSWSPLWADNPASPSSPAGPRTIEKLTTLDGQTYTHAQLVRVINGVTGMITCSEGIVAVPIDKLPDDALAAFGLPTRSQMEARKKQQEALEKQQEAFDQEQIKKGLVKYKNRWVTSREMHFRQADEEAARMVAGRSGKNVSFKILQALPHGSLCVRATYDPYLGHIYDGETFFLYGASREVAAEDEELQGDIYWAGTYTYTTVRDVDRTINSYTLTEADACEIIRLKFHLDGEQIRGYLGTRMGDPSKIDDAAARDFFNLPTVSEVLRKYSISKSAEGPVVEEVTAGSPAQIAGLQQGDLILSLGENKTPDTETLSYAISATMPGTKTTIRLVRLQREMTVPVTIASPEPGGGGPAPQTSGSSMPASVQGCKAFGSGFAVTDNGYIITNYHVVDGAQKVRVKTDEALLPAQVIATDPDNDLALIKVSKALQPVTFSSERVARLGQTVFTVGFPMPDLQGFSPKVTKGVISGLTGMNDDVKTYQIDASVQPGNSGGPLADESGNVVGVVVARLSGSGIQNVNYSIKLPYVLALFDSFPDVAKSIRYAKGGVKLSFEDAVEKVRRATVMIVVN